MLQNSIQTINIINKEKYFGLYIFYRDNREQGQEVNIGFNKEDPLRVIYTDNHDFDSFVYSSDCMWLFEVLAAKFFTSDPSVLESGFRVSPDYWIFHCISNYISSLESN